MDTDGWVPLSARGADSSSWAGPHDGIPAWLRSSLGEWLTNRFAPSTHLGVAQLRRDLVWELERSCRLTLAPTGLLADLVARGTGAGGNEQALDILDFAVRDAYQGSAEELDRIHSSIIAACGRRGVNRFRWQRRAIAADT